jgi:hypothetical protein
VFVLHTAQQHMSLANTCSCLRALCDALSATAGLSKGHMIVQYWFLLGRMVVLDQGWCLPMVWLWKS